MRSRLVQSKDWAAIARQQAATIYSQESMERITAFADSIDQLNALSGAQDGQVWACPMCRLHRHPHSRAWPNAANLALPGRHAVVRPASQRQESDLPLQRCCSCC